MTVLAVALLGSAALLPLAQAAAPRQDAARQALVYQQTVAGNQDLYLVPAGGGVVRRLTDAPSQDGLPRFTPGGRAVVFSSDRSGAFQLWEVPAAGGPARRLRTNAATEWQADLSRDGRLAFLSDLDGPEALWVGDRQGASARKLVEHGRRSILGNPSWSPDGRRIAFSSNHRVGHQIWVVEVATGKQERISSLGDGGCEPRFSPDGRHVVHVSRGHMGEHSRLVERDLESGTTRVLVDWPALNYDPAYSPDGGELAFASNITGEYAVYRQRLSDGRAWRVTFGSGEARYPDYAPR
jgi:TolB protein